MQRKRKDDRQQWGYRVYQYGARLLQGQTPPQWPEPLREVVFAQRDLWQACHAAWQRNRDQYEALMGAGQELEPLRQARDQARQQGDAIRQRINAQRQASRRRFYDGWQADQALLDATLLALRQATDALKRAERAYRDQIRPQLTALLEQLWQEVHALGQASPLAWYNERQVTEAFRQTVERFLKRLGGPPQPRRHLTTAHLTYHFTGPPLTWEQLLGGKTAMIRFDPVPDWVWDEAFNVDARRRASRTQGYLRISDLHTLPFRVTLQRRPPQGALIKGVELVGRETLRPFAGRPGRWTWTLSVLCELPPLPFPRGRAEVPVAALDLNWRRLADDRLRVGMVYDGHGHTPLYFPAAFVQRQRYGQALQKEGASALARCKADLLQRWQTQPLPPELDPRGPGWAQMGQGGLLRLLRQVEALPPALPSRTPTLLILQSWAQRAGKLAREWRGLLGRLDRAKAAWYAVTAKALCTRYSQIAIEALALKRMAEAADQAPRLQWSQQYRQLVGLAAFLQRLRHTAQREGVAVVEVDPAWSTLECPSCGDRLQDQTGELVLICPQGHPYDVDEGAAQVLYSRAFPGSPARVPG
jgi:hypothetical protein